MTSVRVKYQTYEFDGVDLHVVSLRDTNQFFDKDAVAEKLGINSTLWPIFGVVWPSGHVLAHFLKDFDIEGKRILEVGCGIGLASLLMNQRGADITSTDYHPEVEGFLERNTQLNNDRSIPFVLADWKDENEELGRFDLIVGSDLLYEDGHVELLSEFVEQHAKPHCEVIIVDPGRSRQNKLNIAMQEYGYSLTQSQPDTSEYLEKSYKGRILRYLR